MPQASAAHEQQGVVTVKGTDLTDFARQFIEAIAQHRHWSREKDAVPA